ncbi:MAG: cytochrome c3 family protein [Gammaproteobacteria bacterium]|jgi:hypothetical protein
MTQIFQRGTDLVVRLAALGVLMVLVTGVLVWHGSLASQARLRQPVEQPVPFSHKHHVGEVGLDCRYCHTSVENSSFAGIPPTHTCMTCHSRLFTGAAMLKPVRDSLSRDRPLHWKAVHDLPDFVYFDHSVHVRQGVGCVTCHGRVDHMPLTYRTQPLTMRWCLDCHRNPERYLRPREHVFDMDWQPSGDQLALGRRLLDTYHIRTERLTDCSVCHR